MGGKVLIVLKMLVGEKLQSYLCLKNSFEPQKPKCLNIN